MTISWTPSNHQIAKGSVKKGAQIVKKAKGNEEVTWQFSEHGLEFPFIPSNIPAF